MQEILYIFFTACQGDTTNADGIGLCECPAVNQELLPGAATCTGMYQEYFSRSNLAVFIQLGFSMDVKYCKK